MWCTLSRFKDGVPVNTLNAPGKYKIESKYGVHGLIISRLVSSPSPSHSLHPSTSSSPHPSNSSSISPTHPSISISASIFLHRVPPSPSLLHYLSNSICQLYIFLLSPSLSLRLYLYLSTTISVFSISYLCFLHRLRPFVSLCLRSSITSHYHLLNPRVVQRSPPPLGPFPTGRSD